MKYDWKYVILWRFFTENQIKKAVKICEKKSLKSDLKPLKTLSLRRFFVAENTKNTKKIMKIIAKNHIET